MYHNPPVIPSEFGVISQLRIGTTLYKPSGSSKNRSLRTGSLHFVRLLNYQRVGIHISILLRDPGLLAGQHPYIDPFILTYHSCACEYCRSLYFG